ncbi:hypothetical protein [Parasitella parasitica]|uniref:Rgp1-domain-containing protein n=1 Tax=Parasitella parasitica TaxID=35722 RepID=A0A0B7NI23_9FUNG|nr:hypothetical protein [Parasitella parasitica]
MSLSSLASSTYSYLTGSTIVATKEPDPTQETKKETQHIAEDFDLSDQTIEINDDAESMYAQSVYSSSRRSSIESTASTISPLSSRRYPNQLSRLSTSFYRSSSFTQKNYSEHVLWGFAQVVGQFIVDPKMLDSNIFAPLKSKTMYHPFGSSSLGGGGGGMLMRRPDSSYNKREFHDSVPVFSTPPSILFVDLHLAPGETVKYSYKLQLPKNIPPTHKGKSIKFNYSLVIGTQRSGGSSVKQTAIQGHVVQIPFRVFNHVSEDGSRPVYDLMSPEISYTDQAIIDSIPMKSSPTNEKTRKPITEKTKTVQSKARADFLDYIDGLLEKTACNKSVDKIMQKENDLYEHDQDTDEIDNMKGWSCRQNISHISNTTVINAEIATFDICKSNKRVAQLHLMKTLFRLGEPIQGIIDFEGAVIPTFQVSIYLESNEVVDDSIASRQPQYIARVSRKRHAEHHSFCRYDKRVSFSLNVPASESPEFYTSAMKLQYYLKIDFITGTSNASQPTFEDKLHRYHHASAQIAASNFDCQIPIHVFGCSSGSLTNIFGGPHAFAVQ